MYTAGICSVWTSWFNKYFYIGFVYVKKWKDNKIMFMFVCSVIGVERKKKCVWVTFVFGFFTGYFGLDNLGTVLCARVYTPLSIYLYFLFKWIELQDEMIKKIPHFAHKDTQIIDGFQ